MKRALAVGMAGMLWLGPAGGAYGTVRKPDMQERMVHGWLNGFPVVDTPDTHEAAGRMAGLPRELWGHGSQGLAYRFVNTGGSPLLLDRLPYVASEHRKWAVPYAGRRLKVLYVNDTYGIGEAAMLEQRADLDVFIYNVPAHLGWAPWHQYPDYEAFLVQRMREVMSHRPDVIVMQNAMSDRGRDLTLPVAIHNMVLDAAGEGAGLIFLPRHSTVCTADGADAFSRAAPLRFEGKYTAAPRAREEAVFEGGHPIVQGVPLELLAGSGGYLCRSSAASNAAVHVTLAGLPYLATGSYGKGRTVAFGYSSERLWPERGTGYVEPVRNQLREEAYRWREYAYSMVLKAILWAAGETPAVGVAPPPHRTVEASAGVVLSFTLTNRTARDMEVEVQTAVRDGANGLQHVSRFELAVNARGAAAAPLTLDGPLRQGLHMVDVLIRNDRGQVIDWATATLDAAGPLALEVRSDRPYYGAGEDVEIAARLVSGHRAGLRLRTELRDSFGRLMAVRERPAPDGDGDRVRFSLADAVGRVFDVRTAVYEGPSERLRDTLEITVPHSAWGDEWINKLWAIAEPGMDDIYRAVGINALTCGAYAHRIGGVILNARAGFPTYFRSTGPHPGSSYPSGPEDDVHRVLALDPERIARERANVAEAAQTVRRYGALGFVLTGEKVIYYDSSYDAYSLAAFNAFVREKYGSLDALNAQWGSGYERWEDVGPIKTEDWRRKNTPNLSQWMEFRRFMDRTHTEADAATVRWWAEELGRSVPVGHDQSFGLYQHTVPYGCHDYYGMFAAGVNAWISYRGGDSGLFAHNRNNYNDSVQGFAWLAVTSWCRGPVMGLGGWLAGGVEGWANYEGRAWSVLLNGGHGMDWYEPSMFFAGYSALTPQGVRIFEATGEIAAGIGKTLIGAERRTDPVAVWQDMSNEYAAWMLRLPSAGFSRWDMVKALYGNGIKPTVISDQQVEQGELQHYRLLYMPSIACISAQAAAEVRRFAENGGVVVADILAGTYDELGKPLEPGALDDVFGIRRGEMRLLRSRTQAILTRPHPALPLQVDKPALGRNLHWYADAHAGGRNGAPQPEGGAVYGRVVSGREEERDAPAFLINRVGKGYGVFLNFLPPPYILQGKGDAGVYDLARALLEMAGVRPEITLTAEGQPILFFDRNRFRRKEAWYAGLLRYPDMDRDPEHVTIGFPVEGHVYEMRSGRYFGRRAAIRDRFRTGDFQEAVRVYAVLPYRVEGIEAEHEATVVRGEALELSVGVRGAQGGVDHVLRIEVRDARGERPWYHTRNVVAAGGRYRGRVPTALNDPAGAWQLRVTDVISGSVYRGLFDVR